MEKIFWSCAAIVCVVLGIACVAHYMFGKSHEEVISLIVVTLALTFFISLIAGFVVNCGWAEVSFFAVEFSMVAFALTIASLFALFGIGFAEILVRSVKGEEWVVASASARAAGRFYLSAADLAAGYKAAGKQEIMMIGSAIFLLVAFIIIGIEEDLPFLLAVTFLIAEVVAIGLILCYLP